MGNSNVDGPSFEKEERAYNLLLWGSLIPAAPYSEELASTGFYTRIQKERSDKALDAFDREKDGDSRPLSELDAFRILEGEGIFTQQDFYSPAKASNGFYRKRLKEHRGEINKGIDRRDRREPISIEGRVQPRRIPDSDQGRTEMPGSTDGPGDRREYRKGSLR